MLSLLACVDPAPRPVAPGDDTASDPVDTAPETLPDDTGPDSTPTDTDTADGTDTGPPPAYAHLPVIVLDTNEVPVTTLYKIDGTMEVVTDHDGTLDDLGAAPRAWTGPIGIEMHGNSSTGYPKLSFSVETRDAKGADLDQDLLGLGSDSDWVLVAAYGDKTYVRNPLAMDLGRALAEGTDRWEPQSQLVEVFYNGDYFGVYTMTGRIKRDGSRIDLPAPAPDAESGDLTGGYVVKLEYGRDPGFTSARGTIVSWSDPQVDQITDAQSAYVRAWFDDFEGALAEGDASTWGPWLDEDAWVDHVLVQELTHNIDGLRLSTFLWKRPDADGGQLVVGPLWDFDRSLGNIRECECWRPEGWIEDDLTTCGYGQQFASWWETVRTDPAVERHLRCRWEELREGVFSDDALDARVGALLDQVREAEPRDQERWHTLGRNVGFNWFVGETWQEEIDYLHDWLHQRTAWMDTNLAGTCG